MAERTARWCVTGIGVGLLPLLLAYAIRLYYLERPPSLHETLGGGAALLVIVSWLAVALFELAYAPPSRPVLRGALTTFALLMLTFSAVAYGCLSADSVTARVQTRRQAGIATAVSLTLLAGAAIVSTAAVAFTGHASKGEPP